MKKQIENSYEIRVASCGLAFGLRSTVFGLLLLIVFSVLFSSCEDVIDVKLSDENLNLIGVEASITTVDQPTVFLYKTLKVDQDVTYPGISGAVVTISDNATPANQLILTENPAKAGQYLVPVGKEYLGVTGREYTVTIQTEGVTLTAKDKLAKVEPIDSIQVVPSQRGEKRFLGVFTYGKEPKGLGNYYKWDIYLNDTLIHDADRMAIASDEFVDGNYISKLEIYTDFYDTNKPEDRKLKLNDKVQVKQTSISEFAYNFYYQMINQSSTGSLFSVPTANIESNFTASDGKPVLGIFTARDVSVSNQVLIDQKIEDQLKK
ncbi:DUF4249 family protein [Aquipluma nitroreducens]|uniref:DUF4249 family protein n=1 Tax=Aquipluma nitroreducens TaxID=2010828 RepID=UPI00296FB838|nr:DUF4249 family protein [Aquipluma nitroreducens]